MSEFEEFKRNLNHAAEHWATVADAALHEISHGKLKNDNLLHVKSKGRPPNVPFEYCVKTRKKCLLRGVADGKFFCMSEFPCWKEASEK